MASTRPLRVLLTNDDGPPSTTGSPFVYPFALALKRQLGWNVSVVVPSTQKSWVGKSFLITQTTTGRYYYPTGEEGLTGSYSDLPRPLQPGETMEMILIDGTPATCSNLALHSLFPTDHFDLVIAGPNYGRNTSSAFALSSGTIGAAMAASLSNYPAIALSFGLMAPYKGDLLTPEIVNGGIRESCKVVKKLYELGWGEGSDKVEVYTVNVPLQPELLEEGGARVEFTTMARTYYGRLFKSTSKAGPLSPIPAAGPGALPEGQEDEMVEVEEIDRSALREEHLTKPLSFVFAPDIGSLINPSPAAMADGTDTHALHRGAISVTPIRSSFEPATVPPKTETEGLKWRL